MTSGDRARFILRWVYWGMTLAAIYVLLRSDIPWMGEGLEYNLGRIAGGMFMGALMAWGAAVFWLRWKRPGG